MPNLFIIGAPKAGTTTLYHLLKSHPNIYFPYVKEPGAFSSVDENAPKSLEYRSLYEGAEQCDIVGDASTAYSNTLRHPWCPSRIRRYTTDAKIIYILRHPLQRMESQWRQEVANGRIPADRFDWAVNEMGRIIDNSRYWYHLSRYREYFSDGSILVLLFEELKKRPNLLYKQCCRFLGVQISEAQPPKLEAKNPSRELSFTPEWFRHIRQLVASRERIGEVLPEWLKTIVKDVVSRKVPQRVTWSGSTEAWAREVLRPGTRKVLSYGGYRKDYWDL